MQESLSRESGRNTFYKFIFKKSPVQAFSFDFCQILHGTFLVELLRATAATKYPFVRWANLNPKMLLSTWFFLISLKHFQS